MLYTFSSSFKDTQTGFLLLVVSTGIWRSHFFGFSHFMILRCAFSPSSSYGVLLFSLDILLLPLYFTFFAIKLVFKKIKNKLF